MKQRLLLLTAVLVLTVTTHIHAQDAKLRLRDFTPKYRIDTFQVNGEPTVIKRKVIDAVEIKGIKSAFWQEDSRFLTVQYDSKIISLDKIKTVFAHQLENDKAGSTPERKLPVALNEKHETSIDCSGSFCEYECLIWAYRFRNLICVYR